MIKDRIYSLFFVGSVFSVDSAESGLVTAFTHNQSWKPERLLARKNSVEIRAVSRLVSLLSSDMTKKRNYHSAAYLEEFRSSLHISFNTCNLRLTFYQHVHSF